MGRRKKEEHPWRSKFEAHDECQKVLGREVCKIALQGMHPILSRRKRQGDARAWGQLREMLKAIAGKVDEAESRVKRLGDYALAHSEPGQQFYNAIGRPPGGVSHADMLQFFRYFSLWLGMSRYLNAFAKRVQPEDWLKFELQARVEKVATASISEYFVALARHASANITGRTAGLLAIAEGLEQPSKDEDEWERLRKRWDEAINKARRRRTSPRSSLLEPVLDQVVEIRKSGGDYWDALDQFEERLRTDPAFRGQMLEILNNKDFMREE